MIRLHVPRAIHFPLAACTRWREDFIWIQLCVGQTHFFNWAGQFVTGVIGFEPWSPTKSITNFVPPGAMSYETVFVRKSGSSVPSFNCPPSELLAHSS